MAVVRVEAGEQIRLELSFGGGVGREYEDALPVVVEIPTLEVGLCPCQGGFDHRSGVPLEFLHRILDIRPLEARERFLQCWETPW